MRPIVEILKPRLYPDIEYTPNKEFRGSFYQSGKGNVRIPPAPNSALGLAHRYLVLQVHLRPPRPFLFTIRVRDDRANILTFAYSTEKTRSPDRPLSAQFSSMLSFDISLQTWSIVYFDLEELVREYTSPGIFQTLQTIEMKKFATIGKIFAVDFPPRLDLPPELCLPPGVDSQIVVFPKGQVMRLPDATPPEFPIRCSSPRGVVPPPLSPLSSPRHSLSQRSSPTTAKPPSRSRIAKVDALPPPTVIGAGIPVRPVTERPQPRRRPKPRRVRMAGGRGKPRPANPAPAEEEDISDEDCFGGQPPALDAANEEDMDIVFIHALNCYYCPANQQYYEIDPNDTPARA
jgi:hypothetical protein